MFRQTGLFALLLLASSFHTANAVLLNFDDQGYSGPGLFSQASPLTVTEVLDGVTVEVTGGTILTNTSFLPGNATSVYGTADFFSGGVNPITVTFSENITNFFLDVFNGNTAPVEYLVSDNNGNSTQFLLPDNLSGGFETVGFAATGTVVTILALAPPPEACCDWDFFIDNINFNAPLPPDLNPIPVPAAFWLFGTFLVGLVGFNRRRKAA